MWNFAGISQDKVTYSSPSWWSFSSINHDHLDTSMNSWKQSLPCSEEVYWFLGAFAIHDRDQKVFSHLHRCYSSLCVCVSHACTEERLAKFISRSLYRSRESLVFFLRRSLWCLMPLIWARDSLAFVYSGGEWPSKLHRWTHWNCGGCSSYFGLMIYSHAFEY